MELIPNWREVLKRAWTPRLIAIIGIINSAYVITDILVTTMPVPPTWLAATNGALAVITIGARLIDQKLAAGDKV